MDFIKITGARQHNLKNIDLAIPRDALVVITGLSGSGKSSLAFDTLYAEGQRRYVESLSAYARQFLDRLQKPQVEHIDGLSPAIAIEQRRAGASPRSIVATTTEIHDYLRLLYAHIGVPHCPKCGREIHEQSAQSICDQITAQAEGQRLMILAPYVSGRKGEHRDVLDTIRRDGFTRARIDGKIVDLDQDITLAKTIRHTIEAVVDRVVTGKTTASRLTDSIELALKKGNGVLTLLTEDSQAQDGWREEQMSEHLACIDCELSFGKLLPRNFSFNNPYGACPECDGLGARLIFTPESVIPDPSLSIKDGAIPMWRRGMRRTILIYNHYLRCLAKHYNFSLSTPWRELPEKTRNILLYGSGAEVVVFDVWMKGKLRPWRKPFEGIIPNLLRRHRESESEEVRERLQERMTFETCPTCQGARLKPEFLAVTVRGLNIHQFCSLSIDDAVGFINDLNLTGPELAIGAELVKEISSRLGFLQDVGLNYLSLNRESGSLSGGESQRIRLASQIGSGLVGVLYILDEPSIGLHQRDNQRLVHTLTKLRDLGNTVIVVEHDLDTIRSADFVVDLGPGAGRQGGQVIAAGTPAEIAACPQSATGQFLAGTRAITVPEQRQVGNGNHLIIRGAAEHNLKNIDADIPLGTFCCVTGVSGSGKSTLVNQILTRAVNQQLGLKTDPPGKHRAIEGIEYVDKMIVIDQSPIGRTPRSNPATYTGLFDLVRQIFAATTDAKVRGYGPGRFSFNVKGGRCEECRGDGIKKIEMQFLPDVYVNCEFCHGQRYNAETLNVRFKGRNIADVLDMSVNEACEVFDAIPRLKRKLETLRDVGLGYIKLGQSATTLSGGEAQRVKLATELSRRPQGHTLYILDEPTTGLHLADIEHLLQVLMTLRDQGNTILVIEHNLDVIKVADHIIDLGPEGGANGGSIIASGTPEQVARQPKSYTGQFLRSVLPAKPEAEAKPTVKPEPKPKAKTKPKAEPKTKAKPKSKPKSAS
ncbi:MAG: UvrABC system protein A [Lentisphaerae bacterium ADurb.Bin082]|nr:MAG: UvrABC system protein A [Lentisphaerae bacterium ADurb.Bin082]HQL88176.1 excinuclease ABC subunit UvrA [Lentisphaeria bacterium]